jgi:myo-inositol-1(or 4)-monophosphatase
MNINHLVDVARVAVLDAGMIIEKGVQSQNFGVEYKSDGSPTTTLDKDVEVFIREKVLAHHKANFHGEEYGLIDNGSKYTWHCDPIDGTQGVLNGEITSTVSLALARNDTVVYGIVHNPFTKETYQAFENKGAYERGMKLPVHTVDTLDRAVVNAQVIRNRKDEMNELFELYAGGVIGKLVMTQGSVANNLAQVARGAHGVYVGMGNHASNDWDLAAGIHLVKEAGGIVTFHDGGKTLLAATTPKLYDEAYFALNKTALVNYL